MAPLLQLGPNKQAQVKKPGLSVWKVLAADPARTRETKGQVFRGCSEHPDPTGRHDRPFQRYPQRHAGGENITPKGRAAVIST